MKTVNIVWGKVNKGRKKGRLLGFPTANIKLHRYINDGVYISKVIINTKKYSAITFIGAAKTFGQKKKKVECYILNFNQDIYGKWISVKLLKRIRGNIKFNTEYDLILQMKKDLIITKGYNLKSNNSGK
jgi:riboflavin kinase / FMN adenylyltransferase